jgi:hypothetical protein
MAPFNDWPETAQVALDLSRVDECILTERE